VLIKNKQDAEYFNITKAIPVGLFDDFVYTEERMVIEANDQIFLYTDGLTEAEDVDNNLFGDDRLLAVLRKNAEASPEHLIGETKKEISRHVNGHIQSDDLTILSIIYFG
jgi:sigma-B regulation protein RsbU (phosphoserine phosphatase)